MSDGISMVFFRSGDFDLQAAKASLSARGLSVSHDGDKLTVCWQSGPKIHISICDGEWVQQEAAEIGESSPHAAAMANCNVRFEISFDDFDEVLDEINTLIEVQATLQKSTKGFLFNTWNGELSGPDD